LKIIWWEIVDVKLSQSVII